ncbi:MAG: hypothetical protein ISS34_06530 [Candidatus Omnitrophica bacterium]|nr:hypothetical protein [Candidatus Omnitrophota bacterium]
MKVLDAIKKGFEIAGKNMNLVLIVFIFNAIWNLGVIPFTPQAPAAGGAGVTMSPQLTLLSILFVLASIFIQGGVLGSIKDVIKEGKLELGKFAGYGAKFYLRLLCLALIIILLVGVIGFFATFVIAASAPTKNVVLIALATIVTLALILAGIAVLIFLFLSPYILVMEDMGIFQAIRTSIDFVKKLILNVIGLGVMLVLIGFGIGLVMGLVAGVLSFIIKGKFLQVLTGLINGGVNAYLSIVVASCLACYYLAMKGSGAKETATQ